MKKLFCLLFLIFVSFPTFATERINSFHSDINIQLDGSVIITETLNVRHEGKNIRKGLVRSLPTNSGEKYKLISVKRNGQPEPSFVKQPYGFYKINTGDNSFLPSPADSTFEIKYQVWNVLRKYDTHDELYWNVTGDDWIIPISKASASIYLPQNIQLTKQTSFYGRFDAKNGANYHGNGQWSAPYTLSRGEHFTIVAGFTPNIVNITTQPSKTLDPFGTISYKTYQYLTILYILFLGYCITVWYLKGRDPASHAIMPQFDAPKDITATTAYLLTNQGEWSEIGTMTALVQMVQNGFLTIEHIEDSKFLSTQHTFTFKRTEKEPSNDEEQCYITTMNNRNLIITSDQYCNDLNKLNTLLKLSTKKKNKMLYTCNNMWIWPAWGVFAILFYIPFHSFVRENLSLKELALLFVIPFVLSIRTGVTYKTCIVVLLTLMAFALVIQHGIFFLLSYIPILIVISVITAAIFHYYMYRPSVYGQDIIEQLKGLKMFLSATHKSSDTKILKQEQMEELFPFALALGLEDKWEAKFKAIFGSALHNDLNNNTYKIYRYHRHLRANLRQSCDHNNRGHSGFGGSSGFGKGGRAGGGFGGGGGRGR